MKKEYMTPYLAVDFFQLNAAIAGSCAAQLYHTVDQCNMVDKDGPITGDPNFSNACQEDVMNPDNADGYCNQVFADFVNGPYLTS